MKDKDVPVIDAVIGKGTDSLPLNVPNEGMKIPMNSSEMMEQLYEDTVPHHSTKDGPTSDIVESDSASTDSLRDVDILMLSSEAPTTTGQSQAVRTGDDI